MTITRANLWLAQAPGQTEQCVWDAIVMAAIAARKWEGALWQRRCGGGTTRNNLAWKREWSWWKEARDGP
jgi:hypothetical protein